jgi:hypothetical protein
MGQSKVGFVYRSLIGGKMDGHSITLPRCQKVFVAKVPIARPPGNNRFDRWIGTYRLCPVTGNMIYQKDES